MATHTTPESPAKEPNAPPQMRVCLMGFADADVRNTARQELTARGFTVIRAPEIAETLILSPGADAREFKRTYPKHAIEYIDAFIARTNVLPKDENAAPAVPRRKYADAIVVTDDTVTVCDITLPRVNHKGPGLVDPARFEFLVYDRIFMRTLRTIFIAIRDGHHVLLEGATATAKTTAILFAAYLLGQPVRRLNLSGSSDAGDLVGKFIPAQAADALDFERLAPDDPTLHENTRTLLARVRDAGRPLDGNDCMRILSWERIHAPTWQFIEGALPLCMADGAWLVVDEVNLAEASVIERMNPAMESPATLVLTENNGKSFGIGGDVAVHPGFRIMASMNSAHYAGRSVLSEAFRRRFGLNLFVETSAHAEIRQFLRALILGEQPSVSIEGKGWRGPACAAPCPEFANIPEAEAIIDNLARLHVSITEAAGSGATKAIGRHRREPYIFTRETLRNSCAHVAQRIRKGEKPSASLVSDAIRLYYMTPLDSPADIAAVNGFLRACNLS